MQISLTATLAGAYRFVWNQRADFAAYAFLPVLVVALARTLVLWLAGDWQTPFEAPAPLPAGDAPVADGEAGAVPPAPTIDTADLLNAMITMLAYVMFAVAWHRRQLVAGETATVGAALRWGRRQWLFLGRLLMMMVGLAALTFLITLPLRGLIVGEAGMAPLVLMIVIFAVGLVYARLLPIFPAAAVDRPMGIRAAFALTRGNSWRMLGIAVLPPLPFMLGGGLIVSALLAAASATLGASISALLVLSLVQQAFAFAGIAASVSALSIAYGELTDTPVAS